MRKKMWAAAFSLLLLGTGCSPFPQKIAPLQDQTWENVGSGIARYDCPSSTCGMRIIAYRFDKGAFSWRFEKADEPSTVEAWAAKLPQASFVANGAFFDEKWQPTGAFISGGKRYGDQEYELAKSGLVELAPEARVIDTGKEKIDLGKMTEAAQSFPLVIKGGKAVTSFKDTKGARRTMIGEDKKGNIFVIAIPEDAATFADSAQALSRIGVEWANVLNLDGGTSTGFSAHTGSWTETMNSIVRVPIVIVAERK